MPFLVLEGLDGAGKSTQVRLLQQYLNDHSIKYEYLHFPRFDAPVFGELVAKFLRGELGAVDQVDPHLVALIYAGDRADAAPMIRKWLDDDKFVIVDRYVYSNIGYQCAKIASKTEQQKLRNWILEMEYGYYNLPKPDVTLFLDVPFKFTESRLTETRHGDDRDYLCGKQDIHEASLSLQQKVREVYLDQEAQDETFKIVDCADSNASMAAAEVIFERICNNIKNIL